MDTVEATWVGPFSAIVPNHGPLEIGDTLEIPAAQAAGGHWTTPGSKPAPVEVKSVAPVTAKPVTAVDEQGEEPI